MPIPMEWGVLIKCRNHEHAEAVLANLIPEWQEVARLICIDMVIEDTQWKEFLAWKHQACTSYPSGGHDAWERELDNIALGYDPNQPPPAAEAATEEGEPPC